MSNASIKRKNQKVLHYEDLDSDNMGNNTLAVFDSQKKKKRNVKSRRNPKITLGITDTLETSPTDSDYDFKESYSKAARPSRSFIIEKSRTRTKKKLSTDQESPGTYLTDPDLIDIDGTEKRTRGRHKKTKKVKNNKEKQSSDQESLTRDATDDSDNRDHFSSRGPKKIKKGKKTKKISSNILLGTNLDSDENKFSSGNEAIHHTRNSTRLKKNSPAEYISKNLPSDQETRYPTDQDSDDRAPHEKARGSPKKIKKGNKTKKISTEILLETDIDKNKFSSGSEAAYFTRNSTRSKKNSSTEYISEISPGILFETDSDFEQNKCPSSSKVTKRTKNSKLILTKNVAEISPDILFGTDSDLKENKCPSSSKVRNCPKNSKLTTLTKNVPEISESSFNPNASFTIERNGENPKLKRKGTFIIDPQETSTALTDTLPFINSSNMTSRKSSQLASSSSQSVSFNYNSKTPKLDKSEKEKKSFVTPKQQSERVNVSTVERPTSSRRLWTDSSHINRNCDLSVCSPRPGTSKQIKPSNKLPATVRFECSTPQWASTPLGSVKKTPFPKDKPSKSANTSSRVKPPPNFSKIHERQFEKMENIVELQERRAARAQLLLSGCKPLDNAKANKSDKESKVKRPLFMPAKTDKASKLKSPVKKLSKPIQKTVQKRTSLEKKKANSKIPVKVKNTNMQSVAAKYDFTPAHSKKAQTDILAKKRDEVSRYRVNRRFELLMKMRAKKE
ncbi:uncharacterized protein LOC126743836 [Anthonomus grandis grandis]|uniref:uncharacterized protein LOC126743836 n=1 Tax=Anthonomus grandis grandis TaxID=2921223 RepID=UPI002165B5BA|nr:uncharacterized protein LOC126743836 [Anthonomus grandis grandis]